MIGTKFLTTSSVLALAAAFAQTATAQTASPLASASAAAPLPTASGGSDASGGVEQIVVTGSRITATGYTQPTPVTVVGEQILQREAKPSLGDVIRELPAVTGGASPFTQGSGVIAAGTAGLDTINLRGLGTNRTLVLFDGQRVMQSVVTGQVDLGTIPSMLVDRIDVVTAGASAAWGSDAVSGVVNLILNKKFDGLKMSADYGNTDHWDQEVYRFQVAAGKSFAGGKGRIILAGSFVNSPQIVFAGSRDWDTYRQLMPNPAYTATNSEPKYIHVNNVGLSQATTGGLITAGPLKGIQFVGPNAVPTQFNYGITSGSVTANGSEETLNASLDNLSVAFKTGTLFGYTSYDITDHIRASVQFNWGKTHSINSSVPNTAFGNLTIPIDNAYLPASIKTMMTAAGVTSLTMGSTYLSNLVPGQQVTSINQLENTVGVPVGVIDRWLTRAVFTLEGDLDNGWWGNNWKWNAYYQLGRTRQYQTTLNNNIKANLTNAIDAVFAPAGNKLGVPAGTIVCRSSLTNTTNGCVPLDIFGYGVASPAAIRYVNVAPGQNFQDQHFKQDVFSASMQGELPFGLPAGPIALAFGGEHRHDSGNTVVDPGAAAVQYALGNFSPFHGEYSVTEGFAEADVPLLKDQFVESLSFNAAGRITDYSTSGTVETWKVGLTTQVIPDIRLRGTISRDIRAPNLSELFSQGVPSTNSAVDPHTGQNVFIYTVAGGNPNLKPEVGLTYSGGVVLTPRFVPRLSMSTDFYSIELTNAIASVGASTVLANCNAGQTVFCQQLVFQGPNGALSAINTYPVNVASFKTSGLDFQADYSLPFWEGRFSWRLLGNYILNQSQLLNGVYTKYDGAIGGDSPAAGYPKLRGSLSTTYTQGPVSFTMQGRFIGAAKLVNSWTAKDVDKNRVPPIGYLDLRAAVDVNDHWQVFGNIDNVFDQDPPNVAGTPSRGSGAYYSTATSSTIYDVIGRTYRVGVRARF